MFSFKKEETVEVSVRPDELELLKERRREVEAILRDDGALERIIRYLLYKELLSKREALTKRLAELESSYRELTEFDVKAREDRKAFMKLREELRKENNRLRWMLRGRE